MTKETTIYLTQAAHFEGAAVLPPEEAWLGRKGKAQAKAFGEQLRKLNILPDIFVSAKQPAAQQTAWFAACALWGSAEGHPLKIDARLNELSRGYFGTLRHTVTSERQLHNKYVQGFKEAGIDFRMPYKGIAAQGIESYKEVGARMMNALEAIRAMDKEVVVAVSYPKAIVSLVAALEDWPPNAQTLSGLRQRLNVQEPIKVTGIQSKGDSWKILFKARQLRA